MAEWSKAAVLKTADVQASRGSNPFASAKNKVSPEGLAFFFAEALMGTFLSGFDSNWTQFERSGRKSAKPDEVQ